jgi:hypothetical protein
MEEVPDKLWSANVQHRDFRLCWLQKLEATMCDASQRPAQRETLSQRGILVPAPRFFTVDHR